MNLPRGSLVDHCDVCGAWLRPMTPEQHSAAEMIYTELAAQLDWPRGSGEKRDKWWWHQMMLGAYAEEKGWAPQFFPSLTGRGFTMTTRQKQSRLSKKQGSELIEFAAAWAVDNGVVLREREEEIPF